MGNCNTCSIKLFYQGLGRGGAGVVCWFILQHLLEQQLLSHNFEEYKG